MRSTASLGIWMRLSASVALDGAFASTTGGGSSLDFLLLSPDRDLVVLVLHRSTVGRDRDQVPAHAGAVAGERPWR